MSIHLTVPPKRELKPRIVVFGIGGAGGNAVNNMVTAGLEGVDFVVANTDACFKTWLPLRFFCFSSSRAVTTPLEASTSAPESRN